MTLAFNQVGAASIIEIASKTVSGPLRFELERTVSQHGVSETALVTHMLYASKHMAHPYARNRIACL